MDEEGSQSGEGRVGVVTILGIGVVHEVRQLAGALQIVQDGQEGEAELFILPHDDLDRGADHVQGGPDTEQVARQCIIEPRRKGAHHEEETTGQVHHCACAALRQVVEGANLVLQAFEDATGDEQNRPTEERPSQHSKLGAEGDPRHEFDQQAEPEREDAREVCRRDAIGQSSDASAFQILQRCLVPVRPPVEGLLFFGVGRFLALSTANVQVDHLQAHEVAAQEEENLARTIAVQGHRGEVVAKGVLLVEHEGADGEEDRTLEEGDGDPIGQRPLPHPLLHRRVPVCEAPVGGEVLRPRDVVHRDLAPGAALLALAPRQVSLLECEVLLGQAKLLDAMRQVRKRLDRQALLLHRGKERLRKRLLRALLDGLHRHGRDFRRARA
mmetsp:Transcript_33205/g.94421  ORF Transcript_33205/g.94421 Transcript_33205/m.94421 type:complete len:384 (+) Transcript_33205:469-1620(+)